MGGPGPRNRTGTVPVLDGLRVISALVVLFHHTGTLDEDLWDPKALRRETRALQAHNLGSDGLFPHLIGVGPGRVAVEVFLLIAGFVAAHGLFHRIGVECNDVDSFAQRIGHAVYKTQGSLMKRFWRLALPLIPVQLLHFVLWGERLAYGPYLSFPSEEVVYKSYEVGIAGIWSSALSGSLWIMEPLFFAPFVALAMQVTVVGRAPRTRGLWYLMCCLYFSGNFQEPTISPYISVSIGVALADLYNHVHEQEIWLKLRVFLLVVSLIFVGITWYPGSSYGAPYSRIATASGIVFWSLYAPKIFQLPLDNCIMKFCSKFAYQLYIWHLLIMCIFSVNVQPTSSKFALYVGGFAACFATSVVAYYLFEYPSNRFGVWFSKVVLGDKEGSTKPEKVIAGQDEEKACSYVSDPVRVAVGA